MQDHIDQTEEEVEIEAIGIEVDSQPIELYKVLKIADVVAGGGEAKYAISEGYVAVNGELELRKRRKLYDGDLIEFNEEYYVIICDAPVTEPEERVKADTKTDKTAANNKSSRVKPKNKKPESSKTAADKKSPAHKSTSRDEKSTGKAKSNNSKSNPSISGLSQSATGAKRVRSTDAIKPTPSDNQSDSQKPDERTQGGRGSINFF
jgi:ribosome-associated protein